MNIDTEDFLFGFYAWFIASFTVHFGLLGAVIYGALFGIGLRVYSEYKDNKKPLDEDTTNTTNEKEDT